MTLVPRYWPRWGLLRGVPSEARLFQVTPESRLRAVCHWHADRKNHPALLLVHGLEGCHESHYMVGIAHKAWHAGFNVVRMNQRNCGGTEHLTPTLYNGGLTGDIRAVVTELAASDGIDSVWLGGYSMGGNLVLRLAGEVGKTLEPLKGVVAVCPNIHPAACVSALQQPRNWMYHRHFLMRLKARLRRKAQLFPGKFDTSKLAHLRTLSDFDDAYTAPDGGYHSAADYYERTGARHVLETIHVPTLIITAQDDPFIPYQTFDIAPIHTNPWIQFLAPRYGGHCGFLQRSHVQEDMYWSENRLVGFLRQSHGS